MLAIKQLDESRNPHKAWNARHHGRKPTEDLTNMYKPYTKQ